MHRCRGRRTTCNLSILRQGTEVLLRSDSAVSGGATTGLKSEPLARHQLEASRDNTSGGMGAVDRVGSAPALLSPAIHRRSSILPVLEVVEHEGLALFTDPPGYIQRRRPRKWMEGGVRQRNLRFDLDQRPRTGACVCRLAHLRGGGGERPTIRWQPR